MIAAQHADASASGFQEEKRGRCMAMVFSRFSESCVGFAFVAVVALPVAVAVPTGETPPALKPPVVAARSDEPMKASAAFGMPAGMTVKLFAAEPDVANPVAFAIDEQGRVFVCETFRQNRGVSDNRGHTSEWVDADLASQSVEDREAYHRRLLGDKAREWETHDDRVRLLVDTNHDGVADTATVFADGFNGLIEGTAAGILARRGDVFLTCIPSLYRLRDVNSDGRADTTPAERTVLSTGYGARVAFRGHDMHGLALGPDGRLYFTIGDRGYKVEYKDDKGETRVAHDPASGAVFRCEPDGSGFEVFATGLRNPQEIAFDDLGNLFTVDNNSDAGDKARLVHVMPGSDSGWNMAFQYLGDRGPWHREKIWHLVNASQPAGLVPPLAHIGAGPSGFAAYPGTGLPAHFDGRFLLADFRGGPAGSSVRSFRLRPKGASFEPYDEEETFKNVLATDVEFGPDGAVWVSDWVQGWNGEGKGRIWRFLPAEPQPVGDVDVATLLAGDWSTVNAEQLVQLLKHADRRLRLEAQWELARRGDASPFESIATDQSQPLLARVHALTGLCQIARRMSRGNGDGSATQKPLVAIAAAAADPAWEIRCVAARSLGEAWADRLGADGATAAIRQASRAALVDRLADDSLQVRAAAAIALGQLGTGSEAVVKGLVTMAERDLGGDGVDPHLRHAIVMGFAGAVDGSARVALTTHPSAAVRLVDCLAMRRYRDGEIARFLADKDPRIVLEAARAIHDLPMEKLLPTLAACATYQPPQGNVDDALVRRVISAAEKIGTPEGARLLTVVAARSDLATDRRVEAIDALRVWAKPPQRNRVAGFWQFHPATRDAGVARGVLEAALPDLLGSKLDEPLRFAVLQAATELGITSTASMLVTWCHDTTCSPASRAKALGSLVASNPAAAVEVALKLRDDPQPAVRMAARRVRAARLPADEVVPELEAAIGSADVAERQAAVGLLAEIDAPGGIEAVKRLAAKLDTGSLDPSIQLEVREAAQKRLGREVAAAPASGSSEDMVAAWSDTLEGGDVARGRELFLTKGEVSCVRCHHAEGKGGDVGPKLDGIAATKPRPYLLESIVAPNATVAEAFRTTVILTDEGVTVAGILVSEDAERVKLKTADGTIKEVAVASIDERTSGPSSMPADLASKLTRRELRDLIAWLASLTKLPPP
jgi:quinoprotein glucose dehydrogenase